MKSLVLTSIGLLVLGLALHGAGVLESLGAALFGPPTVEARERYAGDRSSAQFSHQDWDALLRDRVDAEGLVDYAGLAKNPAPLARYQERLAAAPFAKLSRNGKLALLINAYNAFTLQLMLDHGVPDSIMDIPSAERWAARRWVLGGRKTSLEEIEHEYLRGHFVEPRIHFAIVCASLGCPPLRQEAYVAERIEEQLAAQTSRVHGDARWVELRDDELRLTKLYQWYAGDFADGDVLEYVARHVPALAQRHAAGSAPPIAWIAYSWVNNGQR